MTADLVQFLRDRYDEEERRARALVLDGKPVEDPVPRHRLPRVLAEIEAKRQLIEMHGQAHECVSYNWVSKEIDPCMWVEADEACTTLRLLALLPYAEHPEHRAAWRP